MLAEKLEIRDKRGFVHGRNCDAFATRWRHSNFDKMRQSLLGIGWLPIAAAFVSRSCILSSRGLDYYNHALMAQNEPEIVPLESTETNSFSTLTIFAGIPLASLGLMVLYQLKAYSVLVIAKRAYIYALALLVGIVASTRDDSPALGTRLVDLTQEILPFYNVPEQSEPLEQIKVLDEVNASTQAVGLPLLVASSLVTSVFFVLLSQQTPPETVSSLPFDFKEIITNLTTLSNAVVVTLFARAELARGLAKGSTIGAIILTALAYVGPADWVWPLQNVLCTCLAINVARAIFLPQIVPILLALSALVVYDVVSVGFQLIDLGSQVLQDGSTTLSTTTSAASSAMGAVALAKTVGMWQPGLFVVRLQHRVSDLLGLGDAVFPSLLTMYCRRVDMELGTPTFWAAVLGMALGCVACELAPGIAGSGLPALLFLVPSMLLAVGVAAIASGKGGEFWSYNALKSEEE